MRKSTEYVRGIDSGGAGPASVCTVCVCVRVSVSGKENSTEQLLLKCINILIIVVVCHRNSVTPTEIFC